MNTTDRITMRGEVMKSVPDGLFKGKHDLYGYATVEVPDRDGDVIKVDGIRLALFKANGTVPLVGAAHRYSATASGDYPTAGKVVEFARTTKRIGRRDVTALAFAADFEKGVDGNDLTEYAKKLKSKYDQRILNSFSIGADVFKASPRDGGRYMVEDSDIYEVSCCLIPSNFEATIMRALKSEFGDEYSDTEVMIEFFKARDEARATELADLMKSITQRFDDIESAIVAASEGAAKPTSNPRSSQRDNAAILSALSELQKQLA